MSICVKPHVFLHLSVHQSFHLVLDFLKLFHSKKLCPLVYIRRECSQLREEISAQKESEMRAALEQLAKMKDGEIAATRAGWEHKVQELMKQVRPHIIHSAKSFLSIRHLILCLTWERQSTNW